MCRSRRYLAEPEDLRPVGADRAPAAPPSAGPLDSPAARPFALPAAGLASTDRTIRASDRDREAVIAQLSVHTGAGRLTLVEFEERVAAATSARTLADLDGLLTDLPVAPGPRPAVPTARVPERWRPWLMTAAICLTIWAVTSILAREVIYFWPFWVIVPWGIVLVAGGGWPWSSRRHLVR
jgi:hypothetical protein